MTGMREGLVVRVEELTRMPAEVQDALITVLSEKTLPIPELSTEVQAVPGFTVIATANDRDKGVNEMSSALRRRFNTVVLPLPASEDDEVRIVADRVAQMGRALELPAEPPALDEVRRVVRVFREAAGRPQRRRQRDAEDAVGHSLHRGGDQRPDQRDDAGGALRRRGRQCARHRRLARRGVS